MLLLSDMRTFLLISIVIASLLQSASYAWGAEFQPMVGIPGLDTNSRSLPEYLNAIYLFLISAGAIIGVIKIALAGVKYATSSSASGTQSAKEDIKGVLLGLLILCIPYIVLSLINPNFTNLDILKFDTTTTGTPSQTQNTTPPNTPTGTVTQCPGSCKDDPIGKCNDFKNECTLAPGELTVMPLESRQRTITVYGCKVKSPTACPDFSDNIILR